MERRAPNRIEAGLLLLAVVLLVNGTALLPWTGRLGPVSQVAVSEWISFLVPLAGAVFLFRWHPREAFLLRPPARAAFWLMVPALGLLLLPALEAISWAVVGLLPGERFFADSLEEFLAARSPAGLVGLLLVMALQTAVLEEAVFRGVVLRALAPPFRPVVSVGVASILFALFHGRPFLILPAFFAGLFLGWAALRSGSLGPPVAAHAAMNAVSVLCATFLPERAIPHGPFWVAGGAVLFAGGVVAAERASGRGTPASPGTTGREETA